MPYSYSIEPTGLCNLKCPECPTGKGLIARKSRSINPEVYTSLLNQISDTTCYLMLYLQGEPFINPNIFEMIALADRKQIYTFISTNGHFMDEVNAERTVRSGLDRIIISLDGTTNETYVQYRKGGSMEVVLAGIKNLVEAKKQLKSRKPYIIIQFIVFKHNQHQINEVKLLGNTLGANKVEIKSAQLYDFENNNPRLTSLGKYSRYQKSGDTFVVKKKLKNRCKRLWSIGVITSDGVMAPCCYDKNADHRVGDATKVVVKNIWKGRNFNNFRASILTNRKGIDICRNCNE
jgi:MoaA/NifB/PqqE/SkfB family radical SAM enzyme